MHSPETDNFFLETNNLAFMLIGYRFPVQSLWNIIDHFKDHTVGDSGS